MSVVALPSSYVRGVVFETPCKALVANGRRCVCKEAKEKAMKT